MNIPSLRESVSEEEWSVRVDLAACYRLAALEGWTDLVFTHISARVPGAGREFLINPYGLLFEEITASSLIRVDQEGRKLSDSTYPVSGAGFALHSAVHAVREDVGCVLHTHTRAGMAVSAQKRGLLPISQQAIFALASLGYHDYEGPALGADEQLRLQQHLGDRTFLVLRNHGLLAAAPSVPEAFLSMYALETACRVQVAALTDPEVVEADPRIVQAVTAARMAAARVQSAEAAWPALLRKLDRIDPSYRT